MTEKSGLCAQQLLVALDQFGVEIQAYHSKSFVGNHIRNMVKQDGPLALVRALGEDDETREAWGMYPFHIPDAKLCCQVI